MDTKRFFSTLARYNVWSTRLLLATVNTLDEVQYRQDCGLFFKSIHGTLNHLLVGEHMLWYPRFAHGISPNVDLSAEVESDRQVLAERLITNAQHWQPLIAHFNEQEFSAKLSYTNMRGIAVSLPFDTTLAHVFNHGTHHRGQITAALTALGIACPELDMVYMLQQEA